MVPLFAANARLILKHLLCILRFALFAYVRNIRH